MTKKLFISLLFLSNQIIGQNNPISLTVISNDSTHAFPATKIVQLIATTQNQSADTLKNATLDFCIQTFTGKEIKDSVFKLPPILPNSLRRDTFSRAITKADFYISNTTFTLGQVTITKPYGFAVEPQTLISPYRKPKDFKQFWIKTLSELQEIPPSYTLTPNATLSNDTMDVYSVEMRSLDSVRVQGWYVVPKGKRNLPALVYLQGYTTNNYPTAGYFQFSNYAQFFLNIRGHGDSKKDINPGFSSYLTYGLKNRSTYIFRGAYMDCIRSLDFLCSRPELDCNRIGIWGGSMGGALALATAALDRRVKLCVFDLPFLSDFRNYFSIANWPAYEIQQFAAQNNIPMAKIHETLDYFDIKNFASLVQCPVMMGSGTLDMTCPPAINFAAFNNVRVREKYFYLFPYTGHTLPVEHYARLFDWFKRRL